MFRTQPFPVAILVSALALPGAIGYRSPHPRQSPQRQPYNPGTHMAANATWKEIHVDERCRILPEQNQGVAKISKPRPRTDPVICHLETINSSTHEELAMVNGTPQHFQVNIEEQEYLLQDVTPEPVIFVVEQPVANGWRVDSDPQPAQMIEAGIGKKPGSTAVFRVNAQPGETVRLHVGVRREKLKR